MRIKKRTVKEYSWAVSSCNMPHVQSTTECTKSQSRKTSTMATSCMESVVREIARSEDCPMKIWFSRAPRASDRSPDLMLGAKSRGRISTRGEPEEFRMNASGSPSCSARSLESKMCKVFFHNTARIKKCERCRRKMK